MSLQSDMAHHPATDGASVDGSTVSRAVLGAVMLITGIAPLATDMYVPGFPAVEHDLSTSAAMVQLTLTTF
ncbi:MAG: transporter, family, multidrug resistance protein, partial [Pseudonocardiales bacterium]|nr:transporter, family, multidrug resistance protein [Pseudonocardiales bacterium]